MHIFLFERIFAFERHTFMYAEQSSSNWISITSTTNRNFPNLPRRRWNAFSLDAGPVCLGTLRILVWAASSVAWWLVSPPGCRHPIVCYRTIRTAAVELVHGHWHSTNLQKNKKKPHAYKYKIPIRYGLAGIGTALAVIEFINECFCFRWAHTVE